MQTHAIHRQAVGRISDSGSVKTIHSTSRLDADEYEHALEVGLGNASMGQRVRSKGRFARSARNSTTSTSGSPGWTTTFGG